MAIQITAVHLTAGRTHQHIDRLWWSDQAEGSSGDNSRAEIVAWIENRNGQAYTDDGHGNRADVAVRKPAQGPKYLQTHADGVWTDNLLALPRR
ncbi:DUF3892 domain-containing protein [Streptomyces hokutonensis]|uniref:DUF3892 domain-containing protein n=1 Tax=Streptomyces hokutonensis TaxID=1306990 RepID=UPI00036A43FC|nr:DUF3892 domain-containing protein [Streptomyces hokutonensis]